MYEGRMYEGRCDPADRSGEESGAQTVDAGYRNQLSDEMATPALDNTRQHIPTYTVFCIFRRLSQAVLRTGVQMADRPERRDECNAG